MPLGKDDALGGRTMQLCMVCLIARTTLAESRFKDGNMSRRATWSNRPSEVRGKTTCAKDLPRTQN